jgi:site-specific recombinase XerD
LNLFKAPGAIQSAGGSRRALRRRQRCGRVRALTGRAVAEIVKRAAKRVGINPSKVAGHSLRSGFATSVVDPDEER